MTTGIHDNRGRAIIYDDQLRDAAVKLIALKARWQAKRLSAFGRPVIISVDEPALAGFGSSEFISISRDESRRQPGGEVIDAIHDGGGLAAIHVCANTDWALVLGSSADIVSFDAYAYFDRFILYRASCNAFSTPAACSRGAWCHPQPGRSRAGHRGPPRGAPEVPCRPGDGARLHLGTGPGAVAGDPGLPAWGR